MNYRGKEYGSFKYGLVQCLVVLILFSILYCHTATQGYVESYCGDSHKESTYLVN